MSRLIAQAIKAASGRPAQEHAVILGGGLNLMGNVLRIQDGEALVMENYEINQRGDYQSIAGIERFDGQPAPSEAYVDPSLYPDDEAWMTALLAERESRRALINPVPGSGPVRGVYWFNNELIAFRDTADGLNCKMYRSSGTGWVEVDTEALEPGGDYKFEEINYAGRGKELVGVDGKNHAFTWDGTTFTQIVNPGMDATGDDKPYDLASLPAEIMLYAYEGGSLQYTALGDPSDWDGVNGAGEIALAYDITAISPQAKDTCAVFCTGRTYLINGRVPSQWEVTTLFNDSGAARNTVQSVGDSIYLDVKGLTRLSRVDKYGDFDNVPMSNKVEPLIRSALNDISCSTTVDTKNQYRLFLKTGLGISVTMAGGEVLGFTTFNYDTDNAERHITCVCSVSYEFSGALRQRTFAGAENGYVYELDRGTSIDGDEITTQLRTSYTPFGGDSPMIGVYKRLRRATLTLRTTGKIPVLVAPSFDYGDDETPEHFAEEKMSGRGEGAIWQQGVFEESYWNEARTQQIPFFMRASIENVSLYIRTKSKTANPHILSSITYRFYPLSRRK